MEKINETSGYWQRPREREPERQGGGGRSFVWGGVALLFLVSFVLCSPVGAAPIADFNTVMVQVANPEGPAYNAFGNGSYLVRFEGADRGLNALHISTDPAVNFGQVTTTNNQSGTIYATDSGGKGYEDDILLLVAVNGTVPDDFKLHVTADGYTWTPNPVRNTAPTSTTYRPVSLDETFTKADLVYGPQNWKPTGNGYSYPIYYGQNTADTTNTFRLMFIDLNAGVLRPNPALENQGAVRIRYSFENLTSFAAFNVYGYCQTSNNGDTMIAWTNSLMSDRTPSGYLVNGSSPVQPVIPLPGQQHLPRDHDGDGRFEDLNGNGVADFSDVVLYFNQVDWIAANEPVRSFDFNGNGRIDFGDVVSLFIRL